MRSRPLETVLVGTAAVILLLLTLFSFWLTARVFGDAETADRLNSFDTRLTYFEQMLRTAESSQRGYLLSGDPEFLEPYRELRPKLLPFATALVAEVPAQVPIGWTIAAILAPLRAKLAEMEETLSLTASGRRDAAVQLLRDGYGLKLTDEIENKVRTVQANGTALIRRNEAKGQQLETVRLLVDGIGGLLIVALTFASLWSLLRANAATEGAQNALARANAELEATVTQRTEALTRANEEIQRFAYIVSHDLRSPLVNIMGFTSEIEALRGPLFENPGGGAQAVPTQLREDFDEALGFIKSSITRMERLIGAILRISREGSRPLAKEPIDTNALVQGLLDGLAHQIRDKAATVETAPLPSAFTDKLALEQIFSNLIENAIKFLKSDGTGRVEIGGYTRGAELIYSVSDNGRGIDPKDHRRIFELFRRAGQQDVPGEGMGLSYVSALVARLGGTIKVQSELGSGSVFKVTLPQAIAQQKRRVA